MADQITGFLSPWLRKKRIEAVYPHIQGQVLDFGCGVGTLADTCDCSAYLGIDSDKESINLARRIYPDYHFDYNLPENGEFDTILGLAVIEHITEPVILLKKLKMMLKPEGRIVLTTPHPSFRWIDDFGSKIGLLSPDKEEHEQFIGYRYMYELTVKAGLVIREHRRFLLGANQLFVLGLA